MKKALVVTLSCLMFASTATATSAKMTASPDLLQVQESTLNKGWLGNLINSVGSQIPMPSGMYFKIEGKEFFFGDYAPTGELVYPGSVWEIRINGELFAHGYGETPRWVRSVAQKYFDF